MLNKTGKYEKYGYGILFFLMAFFINAASSFAALVNCGGNGQNPCNYSDFVKMVQGLVTFALTDVVTPVAVIVIIWGGIEMAISAGDEGKFKSGKKKITAAAIGIVLTFGAWLLVNTILKFLNLPTQ